MKELIEEILKMKGMKYFIYAFVVFLAFGLGYLVIGALTGKHEKFLGTEVNIPSPKYDTTTKSLTTKNYDAFIKPQSSSPKNPINADLKPKQDNVATVSGNDNHVVNGNNNAVGVNGDVVTYAQKHLTDTMKIKLLHDIDSIRKKYRIYSNQIEIDFIDGGDAQIGFQIKNYLISRKFQVSTTQTQRAIFNGFRVWPDPYGYCACICVSIGSF